jgi:hypothetical protein
MQNQPSEISCVSIHSKEQSEKEIKRAILENKRTEQVLPGTGGEEGRRPKQCIHMIVNVKMIK